MDAPAQLLTPKLELKALWRLALPLALAQAGQAMMGLVDTAVIGRVSASAQAGAGLGNSLTFTISFFGMGVMLALDPLVSQAVGAGREADARSHLWQGFWLALLTSVPVMLVIALVPLALPLFGVAPALVQGAETFMWVRLPGVPGLLLFIGARSYLQGVGKVSATFWAMIIANVINLGLDLVLVFGMGPIPPLGIAGAALATVFSTWVQFAVLAASLGPAPAQTRRAFDAEEVKAAAKLGVPVGLHFIAESGLFSLTGILAGRMGEVEAAAHQVALNWGSLTFCVAAGIGSAAATRVGWGVGANNVLAARRSGLVAFGSVVVFMACSAAVFTAVPQWMARSMTTDTRVIALVIPLVYVGALFQISDGLQAVGAGALRGAGETAFTFKANLVGHWFIGLPVALVLGFGMQLGVVGLWLGLTAGLTAVAVMLSRRFVHVVR